MPENAESHSFAGILKRQQSETGRSPSDGAQNAVIGHLAPMPDDDGEKNPDGESDQQETPEPKANPPGLNGEAHGIGSVFTLRNGDTIIRVSLSSDFDRLSNLLPRIFSHTGDFDTISARDAAGESNLQHGDGANGDFDERKAEFLKNTNERASRIIFYLVPLWGILHRSHQDPGTFLGLELRVLPVPEAAVDVIGLLAAAGVAWWVVERITLWRRGQLSAAHTFYMATHFLIFFVGYVTIEDVNHGWLVLNVWHNAQYIAFVWMFNNNRFRQCIDAKARFLSTISQNRAVLAYFLVCFGLSSAIYLAIANVFLALPIVIIIYQAINFHHYIVDGLIWKMRKKPLQRTLGIPA